MSDLKTVENHPEVLDDNLAMLAMDVGLISLHCDVAIMWKPPSKILLLAVCDDLFSPRGPWRSSSGGVLARVMAPLLIDGLTKKQIVIQLALGGDPDVEFPEIPLDVTVYHLTTVKKLTAWLEVEPKPVAQ